MAQSVWRLATGWATEGSEFEYRCGQECLLLHVVQTGSGAPPSLLSNGSGSSSPWVKWPGREAGHSPPTSTEVKKMWIYIATPPYTFMAYCLIS
jgi:hypothetical protein